VVNGAVQNLTQWVAGMAKLIVIGGSVRLVGRRPVANTGDVETSGAMPAVIQTGACP